MSKKKESGIYCIKNINNEKKYIGQTVDLNYRKISHFCLLRQNKHGNYHLQRSWNKYGEESFKFYILEKCSMEDLNNREVYYIELYNTMDWNVGYNLCAGGNGIRGFVHTEEHINKRRETNYSNSKKDIILQIDLKGNIVAEWRTACEASNATGICSRSIDGCVERRVKTLSGENCYYTIKGYIWIYKSDYESGFDLSKYLKGMRMQPITQINKDGMLLKIWDNTVEILRCHPEYDRRNILGVCNGKNKTAFGYIWLFLRDYDECLDYTEYIKTKQRASKGIEQYDINDVFIKEFIDSKEAEKETGIKRHNILRAALKEGMSGGFIWRYAKVV